VAKIRLKFNLKGFRELRTDPKVVQDLEARARRVAQAAGDGVEVLPVQQARNRAHVLVAPVTGDAERRVAKDNSLIRALEAGR
jgi:hypothetical protein